MSRKRQVLAVAVALVLAAAGCSSSHKTGAGGGGGGKTITIGVLADITGLAASGNKTTPQGVEAGIKSLAAQAGYTVNYVVGDDQSSPSGALTAAKKMVTQDHVLAVISVSALAFGAAPYLTQQGIPVIGAGEDGPEWITSKNMFSVYGFVDGTKVTTAFGQFMKMEGVTNVGAVGYGISPSSAEAAKGAAASAQNAGLKVGYLNANFPFGSTNVAPIALAMKSAGVDGFTATVDPNTGFALYTALKQVGVDLKVALLPTGYGGDLLQAGPGALATAQGMYFYTSFEPMEMHTPATQKFKAALAAVGITQDPTYAEYSGYASVALLVQALKAAGSNPTHASLITALDGITGFDAAGLFGSHSIAFHDRAATAGGVDGCIYVTKLSGSTFDLVSGADPICGAVIPGKTVSAS